LVGAGTDNFALTPQQLAAKTAATGIYLSVQSFALSLLPSIAESLSLSSDALPIDDTNLTSTASTGNNSASLSKDKLESAANTRIIANGTGPALEIVR
jgi:hypothetical protein